MLKTLFEKDFVTFLHSIRVSLLLRNFLPQLSFTERAFQELSAENQQLFSQPRQGHHFLNTDYTNQLASAALLHDIGKLGIEEELLKRQSGPWASYPQILERIDPIREEILSAIGTNISANNPQIVIELGQLLRKNSQETKETPEVRSIEEAVEVINCTIVKTLGNIIALTKEQKAQNQQIRAITGTMCQLGISQETQGELKEKDMGSLKQEEFKRMKLHTVIGALIIERFEFHNPLFFEAALLHHQHHKAPKNPQKAFSCYPSPIQGPSLPLSSGLLKVLDSFEGLTGDRPYRARDFRPEEAILQIISDHDIYLPQGIKTLLTILPEQPDHGPFKNNRILHPEIKNGMSLKALEEKLRLYFTMPN